MATEETKVTPSAVDVIDETTDDTRDDTRDDTGDDPKDDTRIDKASESETTTPTTTNYATGANWICKGCGFSNNISNWNCKACYSSMRKSIQKDKNLQRKKQKEQNITHKKRQAKREAIFKAKQKNQTPSKQTSEETKKSDFKEEESKTSQQDDNDRDSSKASYILSPNLPKTMRALVKEKEGKGFILKTDYKVPIPKEGELLIRSFAVAICGSDAILYNWTKAAEAIAKTPFIPGHEAAGLIVGIGKGCRFKIGERVAIENHFFCGDCYQCNNNRKDICANLNQFGHGKGTIYGGCCDYYIAKEIYCYKLKADISWRDAALLEPLGVAYNACERADLNERVVIKDKKDNNKNKLVRETVMIVGCGSIGCMAIGVARTMIATDKIIAVDIFESKLKVAKQMGADICINTNTLKDEGKTLTDEILSLTGGIGVGRIIECSGHAPTINNIFKCLRKGGAVTLVGLPKQPLKFDNPLQDIIFKSIQIRTIHGRRIFKTWKQTEKLLSDRKINLDPIVTVELPLNQFEKAFQQLFSGKALKIVFNLMK